MEFATLGAKCSYDMCRQQDYLPVDCPHCHKTFCKSHYELSKHDCVFDRTQVNLMPVCPICNQTLYVKSTDDPNTTMNRHISVGCKTDVLVDVDKQRIAAKRKRLQCASAGCLNPEHFDTIQCTYCHLKHCLSHRHPEDHKCSNAPSLVKKKPVKRVAETKKLNGQTKVNSSATELLRKLRGNREKKSAAKTTTSSSADSSASTYNAPSKSKLLRNPERSSNKALTLNKKKAVGNKQIEEHQRLYLIVKYPRNAHRAKSRSELVFKTTTLWFNKRFTMGRILDEVCTRTDVDNRNHLKNAKHLVLVKPIANGEDLSFPYDVPAELLAPELRSGDTLRLTYTEE